MDKAEYKISKNLDVNIDCFEQTFKDCNDVVKRKFPLIKEQNIYGYIAYVDSMIDRRLIDESIIENFINMNLLPNISEDITSDELIEFIKENGLGTADIKELITVEEVYTAVLSGDTIILIDGWDKGIMISSKGFPNRGVQEPDTEVVIRGSKEGFTEAFRLNTVLIRRRIRDTRLKIKQSQIGRRSKTDTAVIYIEDLVKPGVVDEVEKRLKNFDIDGVLDSGMVEQLIETKWYSPFPQIQSTQRPDKAASALLDGRVVVVIDNSPFVLLLPTTLNCFFQASDDYYNRWGIASFVRIIRFFAAFIAIALPGLYIAITNFHPSMLPTTLALSFAAAREGVPFPVVVEVVIMELSFELLREAGIRLPGPIGSTIGIVGGLIIGQAAVSANLVSPIIVIIVALTAISSFAVPNDTFTSAFRIIKFYVIFLSAFLGLYGFWLAMITVLVHLSGLKSFNIPYLMPFVASDVNDYTDIKDSIVRFPSFLMKKRPIFANLGNKTRLGVKKKDESDVLK